uniref:Zn(2)-C6 fungal-type domain-containing protein n=1 Tax=Panagrellus redivivus TaxID=6233 RepID=A0A7E4ZWG4_PANRE
MRHPSAMMPSNLYPGFESIPCGAGPYVPQGLANLASPMAPDYNVPPASPMVLYPVPALGNHRPPPPPTSPPIPKSYYQEFEPIDGEYQVNLERHPVSTQHRVRFATPLEEEILIQREQSGDEQEAEQEQQNQPEEKSTAKVRSRRQRAKHLIVPTDLIISKSQVPGLFINVNEDEFDEMVFDNETALAFAARVGLIQNMRRCPKCDREMALCKFNNSCGYRWVCRRTEQGRRFTCSVRGMRKDTVLDDRLVGILTMLRIMFHFSHCVPDSEIISKLDIGHVRSARTILSRLRDMVDIEISRFDGSTNYTIEQLREHFFGSDKVDHFGFLLYWGTRYKPPEKMHDGDDSDDGNDENGNANEFD